MYNLSLGGKIMAYSKRVLLKKNLNNNKVCIIPTDTVMGVACLINSPNAIKYLYKVKNRHSSQPTAVLVSDISKARQLIAGEPDAQLQSMMEKYWPGALTIVTKASEVVPKSITGFFHEVGIRIPAHERLRTFIEEIGTPLVAASANFKGDTTPIKFNDLDPKFVGLVDCYIHEDSLGTEGSTVIQYKGDGQFEYIRRSGLEVEVIVESSITSSK